MNFSEKIKEIRKKQDLTQEQFAEKNICFKKCCCKMGK